MLGGKKKQREKEKAITQEALRQCVAQVDSKFKEYEATADATIQSKFEALNRVLEDHPDKRVSFLLNSIAKDLQDGFLVAQKEVEEIRALKEEAQRSLEEIRSVQKGVNHLQLTSEIDRLSAELKSLRMGNSLEDLILLVLRCAVLTGWQRFELRFSASDTWHCTLDTSDTGGISVYPVLSVPGSRFNWVRNDSSSMSKFKRALQERGLSTSTHDSPLSLFIIRKES